MGGPPSAADQKIATDMLSFLNAGLTEFHAGERCRPLPALFVCRATLKQLSSLLSVQSMRPCNG
jgi:hypothetical protein